MTYIYMCVYVCTFVSPLGTVLNAPSTAISGRLIFLVSIYLGLHIKVEILRGELMLMKIFPLFS